MIHTPPVQTDNGLAADDLAASCARLFARVMVGRPARVTPGPGWAAAAVAAVTLYLADIERVSVADLAAMLRKAYARGLDCPGEETPWEDVPPLTRLAWEAVARHAAWAVQTHDAPRQLAANEAHRADMADREISSRRIRRG